MKPNRFATMKNSTRIVLCLAPLLGALSLSTGCGSFLKPAADPTRFFLLSVPAAEPTERAPKAARAVSVGLRRIELPAYLRSGDIVLRPGGTEVRPAPAGRWAEPLGPSITRVLQETLARDSGIAGVVVYPAPHAARPDFEITVQVAACEGVRDGAAWRSRFVARWEIRSRGAEANGATVATGEFVGEARECPEGNLAELTANLGLAVEALGRELAAQAAK